MRRPIGTVRSSRKDLSDDSAAPARPNRIGLTRATVVKLDGRVLIVRGLNAFDGTQVLDVKPAWASELMRDYFKG